jgi:hypothetical protein
MAYTVHIARLCGKYGILGNHRNRDFLIILFIIFICSYLISLLSIHLTFKITLSSWLLFLGLLINIIASDMISVDPDKFASYIGGGVGVSSEFKYGNEFLRIGFACQLLGLILSVGDPEGRISSAGILPY